MLSVYCESNARSREIRRLCESLGIRILHFPYDPDSHTSKAKTAEPSEALWGDLNLPSEDATASFGDYVGSEKCDEIVAIVGPENRRDALHVDSAYKSGCACFIARDGDIMNKAAELQHLLGMQFRHPDDRGLTGLLSALAASGHENPAKE
jgi:hypothetical protein